MSSCRLAIGQHEYDLALPFTEGHICTASEAAELNALRYARALAMAKAMLKRSATRAEVQTELDAFDFDRKAFEPPLSPLQREAHAVARCALRASGIDPNDTKVAALAKTESILREAQRRLTARRAFMQEALEIDLEGI